MVLRLDPIVAAEQPRQARMPDRDVQMVGIVIGDGFPIQRARAQRHPADRAQILEAIGRDLVLIGRHHLGDRRRARFERDEQEPVPGFERNGEQAVIFGREARIFMAMGHADQPPVAGIAPRVIGAGQHLGAAGLAVDQPRPAVAADVGEGPRLSVVAANDDHALAEIVEAAPVARVRDIARVADDLRRLAQEGLLLRGKELLVEIKPAGQAQIVERVRARLNGFEVRRHPSTLAISTTLRQWAHRWRTALPLRL